MLCLVSLVLHGSGARRILLKNLRMLILSSGPEIHRVADYVEELVARKNGDSRGQRPRATMAMDDYDSRLSMLVKKPARQSDDSQPAARAPAGNAFVSIMRDVICIAPSASSRRRRGAERSRSIDENRPRSGRSGWARSEEVTCLETNRELYGRHEFPEARWAKVFCCSCSRPCTKSTDSSDSVLLRRIRSGSATIDRAFERLPKLSSTFICRCNRVRTRS